VDLLSGHAFCAAYVTTQKISNGKEQEKIEKRDFRFLVFEGVSIVEESRSNFSTILLCQSFSSSLIFLTVQKFHSFLSRKNGQRARKTSCCWTTTQQNRNMAEGGKHF